MSDSAGTAQLVRTVTIKVDGSALEESKMAKLIESRVSQTIGAASRLELRFNDHDFELIDSPTFGIGKVIEISHSTPTGANAKVFYGEVVAIGLDQAGSTLHQCVIEAFDKSHRLSHSSQIRSFTKMKYSDIVSQISGEAGLSAQVKDTGNRHDYVLQTGTNRSLLDEMALKTGMEWFVDEQKLIFRSIPGSAGTEVELGKELVKFRARFSGSTHTGEVSVRGWDPTTKRAIVGVDSSSSATPAGASAPDKVSAMRKASKGISDSGKMTTAALNVESADEANQIAKSLASRNAAHELTARGELLGNPAVKVGGRLTIKGVGTTMGGDYYLTTVEHIFGNGDMVTRFSAGGPQRDNLVDTLGGATASVGGWAAHGFVVGIVTNLNDPSTLNRIKVKFPALSDADESNWARLVNPMAGGQAGWVSMPAIGDEVLVGFEHGDFRRPYVLGSLYNGKDKPPYAVAEGKVLKHGFKTLGGHEMIFNDDSGKESISLIHGKSSDSKVVIEKDKVQLWVTSEKMVEIKAGTATIVLDAGNIKMSGKTIEITAQQDLKLSGTNIAIKANAKLEAAGQAQVSIKGAMAEINSSGPLTIKGIPTAIN
ncbi:MAG: VgrG-related protein [Ilumatobacteraceae bacterium]